MLHKCLVSGTKTLQIRNNGERSCPSPGPRWPEPFVPVSLSLLVIPYFMVPSHLYFTNILRSCGAIKDLLSSRSSQVDFKLGDTLFKAALGLNNIKLNSYALISSSSRFRLIRCQSISCAHRIETNVCYWPDPLDYMIIVIYSLWFWADVDEINVFFSDCRVTGYGMCSVGESPWPTYGAHHIPAYLSQSVLSSPPTASESIDLAFSKERQQSSREYK